jgi:hypothetical protein
MNLRTTSLDPRHIEFDGLALTLFALTFVTVSVATAYVIASTAETMDALTVLASVLVAAGVIAAWIYGYPRHAAIPAMSLVFVCAILALPFVFDMNGALLREAAGAPASRVYVAMGLYVGGLGVLLLAFLVFGFLVPLAGSVLRVRRREDRSRETLMLHLKLCGAAIALTLGVRLLL